MADVYSYGFANNIITVNGQRVGAFSDGDDVVSISPNADLVTVMKGADGSTVYAVSADKGWNVDITLQKASATNAVFRAMANAMRIPGAPVVGVTMKGIDIQNRDGFTGIKGVITKFPETKKGEKPGPQTWSFHFAEGDLNDVPGLQVGAL